MRTLQQLEYDHEQEARGCAANRKSEWKNKLTKTENLYQDCLKNIRERDKVEIAAARGVENQLDSQVDSAYAAQLGGGLQKSTIYILVGAVVVLVIMMFLFMD